MPLSPWTDVATIREATCDHHGTTGPVQQGGVPMVACSECHASWRPGTNPPTTVLRAQVALPGKAPAGSSPGPVPGPNPGPIVTPNGPA